MRSRASCGLVTPIAADLPTTITAATESGFDFVVTPVVHPRFRIPEVTGERSTLGGRGPASSSTVRDYAFTRSDLILTSSDWASLVVAIVNRQSCHQLDCSDAKVRRVAEERVKRELNYCHHIGLSAIMIPLNKPHNVNLARTVYNFILRTGGPQVWMRVPINPVTSLGSQSQPAAPGEGVLLSSPSSCDDNDPWHWWDDFRSVANYEKKLGMALEVNTSAGVDETRLKRWLGEPVKALIIDTSHFLTNKKGFPVLPRSLQDLVHRFVPLNIQILIEGRPRGHNLAHYQAYVDHIWQQHDIQDPVKQYAKGFEDFLQSPLQPLMDNLESCTYEVFEKDPIKYTEYQRAIFRAIQDLLPFEEDKDKRLTLMVLGAGRGPLVRACLEAARLASRTVKVFAVEKNPNAIVTLLTQKEETWGDSVEVISSDMRQWTPSEEDKADIVISELLGSFGDNELSPECLYSAQHLFKEGAISIPYSYTSWIGPLQSSKLYNEVRSSIDQDKNPHANFETPYVVHLQNRVEVAPPQPLFTFVHPEAGDIDNNRYGVLKFTSEVDCQLHGFGGYFECVLYKEVSISINPATHSKGMFSWFPIFFPLRTPVKMAKGQEIELHFWRINNGKSVWYEWSVDKPVSLPIHNPGGRSYTIGL